MKNFARALKEAWRHWPFLAAALCCSLAVAALWGANIAALFPIITTTLHGQPLQAWNQERLNQAQKDLDAHRSEKSDLERRLPQAANDKERQQLKMQIEM